MTIYRIKLDATDLLVKPGSVIRGVEFLGYKVLTIHGNVGTAEMIVVKPGVVMLELPIRLTNYREVRLARKSASRYSVKTNDAAGKRGT